MSDENETQESAQPQEETKKTHTYQLPELIELDLEYAKIPVKLKDKEGQIIEGWLEELPPTERDAYRNFMNQQTRYDDKGTPVGIKNFDGLETDLVFRCMRRRSDGKQFPIAEVRKWPGTAITTLHRAAVALCGLDKDAPERAKNE